MNKRILFISHDGNLSGSIISLSYLVKAFVKKNYEVFVLLPKKDKSKKYLEFYGAKCIHNPFLSKYSFGLDFHFSDDFPIVSIKGFVFLFRTITKFVFGIIDSLIAILKVNPSLLYLNEYVNIHYAIVSKILRIPTVCHIRSQFTKPNYKIRRKIINWLIINLNKHIFVISQIEKDQFIINENELGNKITIVPEFLDERNFTENIDISKERDNLKISNETFVVTFLGGIEEIKGSIDFLKASNLILNDLKSDNIYFIFAGKINKIKNYNYFQKCHELIMKLEITKKIKIFQEFSEAKKLIAISDVLVSCNSISHFSRPIIEAWASNVAVISSRTVHSLQLISDNVNGIFYEIGNYEQLANKILELKTNLILKNELRKNGKLTALKSFGIGINENKVINICEELFLK
ncbi:MAG: glycosyltransferase family 4 protein [Bacteroidetes bacterium]|nr:glycosyltransferase family 4 protein [Bacteroidota bacterium]